MKNQKKRVAALSAATRLLGLCLSKGGDRYLKPRISGAAFRAAPLILEWKGSN